MSTLKADTLTASTTDGDVTIQGNGTGVPDIETGFKVSGTAGLPVADLRVGTDGELITWDASGDPATVAVGTATHVLTSNGVGVAPTFQAAGGGGGYKSMQIFVASGTWTRPADILTIIVACIGPGGGGSGGGGAGGGGTFAMKTIDVTSVSSETVTIGTGGAGGGWTANGVSSSGTTSFGSAPDVGGGAYGTAAGYKNGGAGGAAGTTGDLNVEGQDGFPGYGFAANSQGGSGGSCGLFGVGGAGGTYGGSGQDGQHGGGGGARGYGGSGGEGGDGLIVVWEYA